MNFNLERLKSSLQQENEILKRRLEKQEKKGDTSFFPLPMETKQDQPILNPSVEKVEKYYR